MKAGRKDFGDIEVKMKPALKAFLSDDTLARYGAMEKAENILKSFANPVIKVNLVSNTQPSPLLPSVGILYCDFSIYHQSWQREESYRSS